MWDFIILNKEWNDTNALFCIMFTFVSQVLCKLAFYLVAYVRKKNISLARLGIIDMRDTL